MGRQDGMEECNNNNWRGGRDSQHNKEEKEGHRRMKEGWVIGVKEACMDGGRITPNI